MRSGFLRGRAGVRVSSGFLALSFLVAEYVAGILVTLLGFGGPWAGGLASTGPNLGAKARLFALSLCLWVSSFSELCFLVGWVSLILVFLQQYGSQVCGRAFCVTLRCLRLGACLWRAVSGPVLFERHDTCLTQLSQLHLRLVFFAVSPAA